MVKLVDDVLPIAEYRGFYTSPDFNGSVLICYRLPTGRRVYFWKTRCHREGREMMQCSAGFVERLSHGWKWHGA